MARWVLPVPVPRPSNHSNRTGGALLGSRRRPRSAASALHHHIQVLVAPITSPRIGTTSTYEATKSGLCQSGFRRYRRKSQKAP
jgi:hypothetical protein